ncbi:MAG TPA: c-type cytochrome [Polyangiaceae bacterium]|nr:c-type cytochrome [Polyangiaceae bacterium]
MNQLSLVFCSFVLVACGGSAPPAAEPTAPATPDSAAAASSGVPAESMPGVAAPSAGTPGAFAAQAQAGQALYGKYCGGCHGAHGNDGKAPPVVGLSAGALPLAPPPTAKMRKTQFKTVADVADFVAKTMPPRAPGSLSADDYYAILAFDLQANGIDLGDKKLDPALAATLEIPRK